MYVVVSLLLFGHRVGHCLSHISAVGFTNRHLQSRRLYLTYLTPSEVNPSAKTIVTTSNRVAHRFSGRIYIGLVVEFHSVGLKFAKRTCLRRFSSRFIGKNSNGHNSNYKCRNSAIQKPKFAYRRELHVYAKMSPFCPV